VQAGIQTGQPPRPPRWIPACAGMTRQTIAPRCKRRPHDGAPRAASLLSGPIRASRPAVRRDANHDKRNRWHAAPFADQVVKLALVIADARGHFMLQLVHRRDSQARTNRVRFSARDARRGHCPIIYMSAHSAARTASNSMPGLFGTSIRNPGRFQKRSRPHGATIAMAKPLSGKSKL